MSALIQTLDLAEARRRLLSRRAIAWSLAIVQVLVLAQLVALSAWTNTWFAAEFAIPGSVAFVLVGALVASQRNGNRLGWFLLLMPVPGLMAFAATEYDALSRQFNEALPAGAVVAWVGEWIWTPSVGIAVAMLIVRFPDGLVPPRWRFVDYFAAAATILLSLGIACIALPAQDHQLSAPGVVLISVGLGGITLAAVAALASLFSRYRHGDRELRLKIKWMLLAAMILTVALIVALVLEAAFNAKFGWVFAPFFLALLCVPIAIGVAIFRHHLFDIDLIISRTLVYVIVTAVIGGLYIGVIEVMQQLSIFYTGQKSETAIVLTAFVVAGAFSPVEKWADRTIERRLRRDDPVARLQSISASAESVVRVIEAHRFARWLVDESVTAFGAEGGVLYLYRHHPSAPFHSRGRITAEDPLTIPVHHSDEELGRLVLGRRRGGIEYSNRDVMALKRTATALGSALVLATDLGHIAHNEFGISQHDVRRTSAT